MNDKELGLKVFRAFWDWNRRFNPITFSYSLDEFLNFYGNKRDIYLDGIGAGVRLAEVSDVSIDTAMRSMAQKSGGKIPSNPLVMVQYLSNEATKVNWVDAASFVAVESGKDILSGAEEIGNSVISSGKLVLFLLPVLVLIFILVWMNNASGGGLVKAAKGLRK